MIISVDFYASFGFFKKPDINDTIFLTYNWIHKPVVLGIFGAILGLSGHKREGILPEYYEKLKNLRIGIQPITFDKNNSEKDIRKYHKNKGNFEKIIVKYNDATGISGGGATLNVVEQILVKPAYRIYIEINESNDLQKELREKLRKVESIFIPYFGKNEFHCWWNDYKEYKDYRESKEVSNNFKLITIFSKPDGKTLKELKKALAFGFLQGLKEPVEEAFTIFERLPVGFDTKLNQYSELQEFVYTNITFDKKKFPFEDNFKEIKHEEGKGYVIYLF